MSDISFPVSEEPEADLASGDQALPMGVLGTHNERLTSGLDGDNSPHTSGETVQVTFCVPVIMTSVINGMSGKPIMTQSEAWAR